MNKAGHPDSLFAEHPGNGNALRHGAFSERVIGARAAQIGTGLIELFGDSPRVLLAINVYAPLQAIIELMDAELEKVGLTHKNGKPHYLIDKRIAATRRLGESYDRLIAAVDAAPQPAPELRGETTDYIARLQAIALRHLPGFSAKDRITCLIHLTNLGVSGTASGAIAAEARRRRGPLAGDAVGKGFRRGGSGWTELPPEEGT